MAQKEHVGLICNSITSFLPTLLAQLIPNTTAIHAIIYTNFSTTQHCDQIKGNSNTSYNYQLHKSSNNYNTHKVNNYANTEVFDTCRILSLLGYEFYSIGNVWIFQHWKFFSIICYGF